MADWQKEEVVGSLGLLSELLCAQGSTARWLMTTVGFGSSPFFHVVDARCILGLTVSSVPDVLRELPKPLRGGGPSFPHEAENYSSALSEWRERGRFR